MNSYITSQVSSRLRPERHVVQLGCRRRPLSSTRSSTHRRSSDPTNAGAGSSSSAGVAGVVFRSQVHGTRITERDAVERHLGAEHGKSPHDAATSASRATQPPPVQGTRSGHAIAMCAYLPAIVRSGGGSAEAQPSPGRRYRAPSLLCRKRVVDALLSAAASHAWNLHDERSHAEAGVNETSGAR